VTPLVSCGGCATLAWLSGGSRKPDGHPCHMYRGCWGVEPTDLDVQRQQPSRSWSWQTRISRPASPHSQQRIAYIRHERPHDWALLRIAHRSPLTADWPFSQRGYNQRHRPDPSVDTPKHLQRENSAVSGATMRRGPWRTQWKRSRSCGITRRRRVRSRVDTLQDRLEDSEGGRGGPGWGGEWVEDI